MPFATPAQWILGVLLILSSIGVISFKKPVHSSLSFLFSLLMLAGLYLQLSADFIAVMQILVYAGAILVIFMFVIVLFQDAHAQIDQYKSLSPPLLSGIAAVGFLVVMGLFSLRLFPIGNKGEVLHPDYGTVQTLGKSLYLNFFFPFEAIVLLFLIAIVGALYIAKKER